MEYVRTHPRPVRSSPLTLYSIRENLDYVQNAGFTASTGRIPPHFYSKV